PSTASINLPPSAIPTETPLRISSPASTFHDVLLVIDTVTSAPSSKSLVDTKSGVSPCFASLILMRSSSSVFPLTVRTTILFSGISSLATALNLTITPQHLRHRHQ